MSRKFDGKCDCYLVNIETVGNNASDRSIVESSVDMCNTENTGCDWNTHNLRTQNNLPYTGNLSSICTSDYDYDADSDNSSSCITICLSDNNFLQ